MELLTAQLRLPGAAIGPNEMTLVEPPHCTSQAKTIVNQQLYACVPGIGKQVAVVRLRRAKYLYYAREQSLGPVAQIHRLHRQPQCINADHRNTSRSQAPI